jgi:dephospho-CoA kinase
MVIVANELRSGNTPSFIVEQLYNKAVIVGKNCIIESIRTPGEVKALKAKGKFRLFAVDAKPELRFERIKIRNSETDQIDYNTFLSNEQREMNSDDPNRQNLFKCIELADFIFINNGRIEDLFKELERVLSKIEQ